MTTCAEFFGGGCPQQPPRQPLSGRQLIAALTRGGAARGCIFGRRLPSATAAAANGQPAFGTYRRALHGGIRHGTGLLVLTLAGDRIGAMTRFDNSVFAWFGLPRSLPG
jgi:hypothetical protein